MSADLVEGFAMRRFAFTPSPSPTGVGEGSAALSVEASHNDQPLYSITYSVRPSRDEDVGVTDASPPQDNERNGYDCLSWPAGHL